MRPLSLSSRVPDPPLQPPLCPLLLIWERNRPLFRCHNTRFAPAEFNPGKGLGRFHPFSDPQGKVVPTLYAAEDFEGALSETVFHGVPVRGPGKRIRKALLNPLVVSTLICGRDLRLVQLFGLGLRRLGVTRLKLIEASKRQYPRTAAWAQALHAGGERPDGLAWVSRQNDGVRSMILFGDRVAASELRAAGDHLPLKEGPGYETVLQAADRAGILIYE